MMKTRKQEEAYGLPVRKTLVRPIKCPACRCEMIYEETYKNLRCTGQLCEVAISWMNSTDGNLLYWIRTPDANPNDDWKPYNDRAVRFWKEVRTRIADKTALANNIPYGFQIRATREQIEVVLLEHGMTFTDFVDVRKRGTRRNADQLCEIYNILPHIVRWIKQVVVLEAEDVE